MYQVRYYTCRVNLLLPNMDLLWLSSAIRTNKDLSFDPFLKSKSDIIRKHRSKSRPRQECVNGMETLYTCLHGQRDSKGSCIVMMACWEEKKMQRLNLKWRLHDENMKWASPEEPRWGQAWVDAWGPPRAATHRTVDVCVCVLRVCLNS